MNSIYQIFREAQNLPLSEAERQVLAAHHDHQPWTHRTPPGISTRRPQGGERTYLSRQA